MSILVATININQPDMTNNVVEQARKDKSVDCEIMVLENGATEPSKYSTHISEKNYFYGGGLNLVFDYFLNETSHDWLTVFNNDIIFHGERYLSTMLATAQKYDLSVLSPVVMNASLEQNYWKQMHSWMSDEIRYVDWVDFQAVFLRRDICEIIGQYPLELIYGWGNDILTGIIAKENNLKVGVTDKVCVVHLNSQSMKKGVEDLEGNIITTDEYCRRADAGMNECMQNLGKWDIFMQFKHSAANYSYRP